MVEFKGQNGANIKINPAGFEESVNLRMAITKELSKADFNINASAVDMDNIDVSGIAKLICVVDSSREVNDALFACLSRCTYNKDKITKATFEPVEAREDYYEIVISCLKVNLSPFFKGLISKLAPFMATLKKAEEIQK